MGVNIDYKVIKHGLYPDIIGCVESNINGIPKGQSLKPINLTKRSDSNKFKLTLYCGASEGQATEFYINIYKPAMEKILHTNLEKFEYELEFIDTDTNI